MKINEIPKTCHKLQKRCHKSLKCLIIYENFMKSIVGSEKSRYTINALPWDPREIPSQNHL